MSKKLRVIEGYFKDLEVKRQDRAIMRNKTATSNGHTTTSTPKNNDMVFSKKPEPNRGVGDDRHPNVPRGKVVGPRMESRENEYRAHTDLSSSKRASGHYLMKHGVALHNKPHPTAQVALSAYNALSNKSGVKIHQVKEGVEAVVNPTTLSNYKKTLNKTLAAAQAKLRISNKSKPMRHDTYVPPKGALPEEENKMKKLSEIVDKLIETLSPNAKAGDYIDDFVHSKNKMFKNDSKKQRIKRALGAYYAKKNEEIVTEEIKPYVSKVGKNWEVLDHSGETMFAHKDYGTAKNHLQKNYEKYRDPKHQTKNEEIVNENFRELAKHHVGVLKDRKQATDHMNMGNHIDFYHPSNGDKVSGTVHKADSHGFTMRHKNAAGKVEKHRFTYHHLEEAVVLDESWGEKHHSFKEFKQNAEDFASRNSSHGRVEYEHRKITAGDKTWHQTASIVHDDLHTDNRYRTGIFNHIKGPHSEEGHGQHLSRYSKFNEEFAMAVGNGDPAHVTNPTDNYAAQRKRQEKLLPKTFRMLRRKKLIK